MYTLLNIAPKMHSGSRDLFIFVRPVEDDESAVKASAINVKRVVDELDVPGHDETKGKDIKAFYENLVFDHSGNDSGNVQFREGSSGDILDDKTFQGLPLIPDKMSLCSNVKKKRKSQIDLIKDDQLAQGNQPQCPVLQNKLLKYSQIGDLKNVQRLVDSGVDVNFQDLFGWTALMTASCSGRKEIVLYLLQNGADVSITDKNGRNAISLAEKNKHMSISALFKSGANSKSDTQACSEHHSKLAVTSFREQNSVEYVCDICKSMFKESEKKHLSSTLHLFNLQLKPNSTNYFITESNCGFQMMVKQGWDVDKGLGSEGQGRKFPVMTVLKRDRHGLGSKEETKLKHKVTHFSAGDTAAVKRPIVTRTMRAATLSKKLRAKKESKEKRWERNFRSYMNTD